MSGLGIYDYIIKSQYDSDFQITYDPLSCCNDSVMADRCKIKNAKKAVWSIKASAQFNSESAIALRAGFLNNRINLLINENDADDVISTIKGISKLSQAEKHLLKLPYIQTSLLINEIVNLECTQSGTMVKVKERSGMRKDRFSALEYSYKIASDIAILENRPVFQNEVLKNFTYVRKPKLSAFQK